VRPIANDKERDAMLPAKTEQRRKTPCISRIEIDICRAADAQRSMLGKRFVTHDPALDFIF